MIRKARGEGVDGDGVAKVAVEDDGQRFVAAPGEVAAGQITVGGDDGGAGPFEE